MNPDDETKEDPNDDVIERRRVREVAAVFHDAGGLESAVEALLEAGFDRSDIDIMGDVETVRQRLGQVYVPPEEIPEVPGVPRRAFVARDDLTGATAAVAGILFYIGAAATALSVVASGGSLALVAATAAVTGTLGAGIGASAVHLLGKKQAEELERQLMEGGIVVWVRVRSPEKEGEAREILARFNGKAIRVHEIEIDKRLDDLPLANLRPDPWLGSKPLAGD